MTDTIAYKPSFAKHIGGRLYARFRTNPNGDPAYHEDADGLRHFTIDVYLESPVAEDIDLVEYTVNDPTFYDPKGYADEPGDHFHEVIGSYGDVPVTVKVYVDNRVYSQQVSLYELLRNGHADHTKPSILDALERIKNN